MFPQDDIQTDMSHVELCVVVLFNGVLTQRSSDLVVYILASFGRSLFRLKSKGDCHIIYS